MRIEQLQYITDIERTGSIAHTSERLFISSPGISLAISNLEEELGVKLFDRSRTGLEPTVTGKKIIIKAQEILNRIEEFKLEAKSGSSEIEGQLSIASVSSFCKEIIPKTSVELKSKFPGITLKINETGLGQVHKEILKGNADIGIIFDPFPSGEEHQLLVSKHLFDSIMMVSFRKDSALSDLKQIYIEDIIKYPIALNYDYNNGKDKYFSQTFGEYNKLNIQVQSQNSETKKHFIAHGLAIGIETELSVLSDPFYQREDIIVKPVLGLTPKISYHYIHLKNQHLSTAAKVFLKELMAQIESFNLQL
ncbi:MAG: LysR family transcriptional regulator [Solibacillus sp.]